MSRTLEDLLREYTESAMQRGAAIDAGNARSANRTGARLKAIRQELRRRGDPATPAAVLSLTQHPNPWVRLAAAFDSLEYAEVPARKALEELAAKPGFVGVTAATILNNRGRQREVTMQP